ncbi:Carboxy-S-adenosyl-L-methionine synthase [subsurface metagenome]
MSRFFNEKANGYDQYMKQTVTLFKKFYNIISVPIDRTKETVEILNLGCGTGLELEGIFSKAPNAAITCIDLSEKMLSKLKSKYSKFLDQIKPVKGSYLMVPFPEKKYDYVVSVMTMHHFPYDTKCKLYKKIRKSMKNGGKYIEGDYVVSLKKEQQFLLEYNYKIKNIKESERNIFHIYSFLN